MSSDMLDLLVVGAGPTGIAVGCEAVRAGLSVKVFDRGALTNSFLNYPNYLTFFTTRDRMEIAGVPLSIPDEKANRQQALAYYRAVAKRFGLALALHEEVLEARRAADGAFCVSTRKDRLMKTHWARAVVIATGYFDNPIKLDVPGMHLPWVKSLFREAYPHYGEEVLIVGGGNSACKTALDLWRNGARVTMAVRDQKFHESVKYWILPDIENRVREGSITAHMNSVVAEFTQEPRGAVIRKAGAAGGEGTFVSTDAAYVLIGYRPDETLLRNCGVEVDAGSLVPRFDPATCETNVPGLFVAGTVQAGLDTDRVFIDNSRDHGARIVEHLARRLTR
ncbi:MAG: YpdA family putative bacillithiol disulfide reductase [Planctomycetota bacterium]|nr:YpdA family putative bacillithiol disulfide reductase [Planctomycetota bacterium]